jgi:simple sugar transport system permease protein
MLADGLSRVLLKVVFGSTSNSPRLDALVGSGPLWLLGVTFASVLLLHGLIYHSVLGLRLRAVGDKPAAAQALSVSVLSVRMWAVGLSGLLTAIGGVYLVFEQRQFVALMSGGRGFLALAAMIFGGWRPVWGAAAALLFATAEATGIFLQARGLLIPNWILQSVPYVLTLLTLMLRGLLGKNHSTAPLSLGIPRL